MLQGTIDSNRMEVKEAGELLLFGGGVTMVVTMESKPAASPSAASPAVAAKQPIAGTRSAEAK
jgi:hypothetical protein